MEYGIQDLDSIIFKIEMLYATQMLVFIYCVHNHNVYFVQYRLLFHFKTVDEIAQSGLYIQNIRHMSVTHEFLCTFSFGFYSNFVRYPLQNKILRIKKAVGHYSNE